MLALTDYLRQDVVTASGERVGRVRDLAVRLDEEFPPVCALIVDGGGPPRCIAWDRVAAFERSEVALVDEGLPARDGQEELWLRRDVLDCQVVDIEGKRLARVGDVELARQGQELRAVAVDIGLSSVMRRLGLRRLARRLGAEAVSWDAIHLASGRGHELQLGSPAATVHRLRGEELMHLVGRLPVERGADVLRAVSATHAAGALGASRPPVAASLLRELGAAEAPEVLTRMPLDDSAAALRALEEPEREQLLAALETDRARDIRRLLEHEPETAGAIMTPDVRTAAPEEPLAQVRARVAADPPALDGLLTTVIVDEAGRPLGVIPATSLISGHGRPVPVPAVSTDTPLEDVMELFATYDVLAVPVVGEDRTLVGMVAIDDILDELLAGLRPGGRRYEVMSARRRAPA